MNKFRIALAILKNPTTRRVVLQILKFRVVQQFIARWALRRVSRYLSRR